MAYHVQRHQVIVCQNTAVVKGGEITVPGSIITAGAVYIVIHQPVIVVGVAKSAVFLQKVIVKFLRRPVCADGRAVRVPVVVIVRIVVIRTVAVKFCVNGERPTGIVEPVTLGGITKFGRD